MKYIDEYRDKGVIGRLAEMIGTNTGREYTFMEVCGGHTAAVRRFGISSLLPENIRLISGPGCPVCVTGTDFIDKIIEYSKNREVIIATFGDLMRVPGSSSSLEKEKAAGGDIRVVFSGLEALEIARVNSRKKVVFPGIGFETTAPGTAATIIRADEDEISNFYILSAHKLMPPAMEAIIKEGVKIDGFICPGHVAAVTGSDYFEFIPGKYNLGCVITGFEPSDILQSVNMLINQVKSKNYKVENQYKRVVTSKGNLLALRYMAEIFEICDSSWRGLGVIRGSGLKLRSDFERYDAEALFPHFTSSGKESQSCICGEILRGVKSPPECPLFGTKCLPEDPAGACMVSNEGACNTWYKYRDNE